MSSFSALIENSLLIERCTVFKWYDYEFSTGEKRDKFWITLNCKLNEFPINVILPTSQHDNNHYSNGKNLADCVIVKKNESVHFISDITILDLKNIHREDENRIRMAYEDDFLIECGPLEKLIVEKIETTIKDSELMDIYLKEKLLCQGNT